jgi:hypothetical protein
MGWTEPPAYPSPASSPLSRFAPEFKASPYTALPEVSTACLLRRLHVVSAALSPFILCVALSLLSLRRLRCCGPCARPSATLAPAKWQEPIAWRWAQVRHLFSSLLQPTASGNLVVVGGTDKRTGAIVAVFDPSRGDRSFHPGLFDGPVG